MESVLYQKVGLGRKFFGDFFVIFLIYSTRDLYIFLIQAIKCLFQSKYLWVAQKR